MINADGLVLTNHHVINGSATITPTAGSTGTTYRATVVGYDTTRASPDLLLNAGLGDEDPHCPAWVKLRASASATKYRKCRSSMLGAAPDAGGARGGRAVLEDVSARSSSTVMTSTPSGRPTRDFGPSQQPAWYVAAGQ